MYSKNKFKSKFFRFSVHGRVRGPISSIFIQLVEIILRKTLLKPIEGNYEGCGYLWLVLVKHSWPADITMKADIDFVET